VTSVGFVEEGEESTMPSMLAKISLAFAFAGLLGSQICWAGEKLRINIPRRTHLTPVQRLNREGVEAVRKHDYERASVLFYRAYLYDPADPFTLNNLGYVAELQGQLDRARRFYNLASTQSSSAEIDLSNTKSLEGEPMHAALDGLDDRSMRVNRMNMDAMQLLRENRGFDATEILRATLALDPSNPFTLNNLGVAHEAIGDYDKALKFYAQAADAHSSEPVVVALDEHGRGHPVSRIAAESEKRLEKRLRDMTPAERQSVMFTMRGVMAVNRNDWAEARQDFLKAYSLNPSSGFSLNNRGYVAENDGDLESAQFFYAKARSADNSGAPVGLATRPLAERQALSTVASDSNQKVDYALEQYSQQRRRESGPVELTPRDASTEQQQQPSPHVLPEGSSPLPH
jgi:Flp pilus assembly protein TadD